MEPLETICRLVVLISEFTPVYSLLTSSTDTSAHIPIDRPTATYQSVVRILQPSRDPSCILPCGNVRCVQHPTLVQRTPQKNLRRGTPRRRLRTHKQSVHRDRPDCSAHSAGSPRPLSSAVNSPVISTFVLRSPKMSATDAIQAEAALLLQILPTLTKVRYAAREYLVSCGDAP